MALTAQEIRSSLDHPVIDADGHWLEFGPIVREQLQKIGGDLAVKGFSRFPKVVGDQLSMSVAERRRSRTAQQAFWSFPTKNTRDRATALMPRLLYERLDEFGVDYAMLYPTGGLGIGMLRNDTERRATVRAFNIYIREFFGEFSDRMTPAAIIPMYTPGEAIEELEFVTNELGLKVIVMGSLIPRQAPASAERYPEDRNVGVYRDVLALDSDYDYDPVWAKCVELGVAPTFHSGSRGFGLRMSPSNFVYNHIGHFAVAGEAMCKAVFLGGVTHRFPTLNFAFLEGGVGWACGLFSDLIEHWERRHLEALAEVDPANVDHELMLELARDYGDDAMVAALADETLRFETAMSAPACLEVGGIDHLDDFAACEIGHKSDFVKLFVDRFYFGCEADDKMNAWAFNRKANPFGAEIKALYGSDIGHFDVPDMAAVLPEAYELVEDELIDKDNFKSFVFGNAVRFWGEMNPSFFDGTVVEKQARALLRE